MLTLRIRQSQTFFLNLTVSHIVLQDVCFLKCYIQLSEEQAVFLKISSFVGINIDSEDVKDLSAW